MKLSDPHGRRAAVLFALILVVAACTGGGATTTTAPATTTAAPTSTTNTTAPTTTAPAGIDRQETLTYVHDRTVENLDPDMNPAGTPLAFFFPIYDRLVHLTPTGELTEGLAIERNFIDDGATLELVLREGVVFHDGTPFNAEAVKFNLERSATLPEANNTSITHTSAIESVDVIDEYLVHIHRKADPAADAGWALIESRLAENIGMMVSPTAAGAADFDQNPVGAGPFRLTSFTAEKVEYERFEDYWDPEVGQIQKLVIFQPLDSEAVLAGLASGRFDVGSIDFLQMEQAEQEGLGVEVVETSTIMMLLVNHTRPPFDDSNFRQALLYGIDRQTMIDVVQGGLGSPTVQNFAVTSPAYNPECGLEQYPYDPGRAAELVAASPYANDAIVELLTINQQPFMDIAELIQANLAEAGITVEIILTEQAQFARMQEGEFDLGHGRRGRTDPFEALENSWATTGNSNPGGFNNQAIQDILAEIASTTDPGQRAELVKEASCLVIADGHSPGLYGTVRIWAQNECVVNFVKPITLYPEFRDAGITQGCRG